MRKTALNISVKQKIAFVLCGVFLSLLIIEIFLRFGGWIFLSIQEQRNKASLKRGGEYTILCIGESTTALGGIYSYPSQLEKILNNSSEVKFSVINKGTPSTNSGKIVAELTNHIENYNPDMVISMMGINDRGGSILNGQFSNSYSYNILKQAQQLFQSMRIIKLAVLLRSHIQQKFKDIVINQEMVKADQWIDNDYYLKQYYGQGNLIDKPIHITEHNTLDYALLWLWYHDQTDCQKAEEVFNGYETINLDTKKNMAFATAWCYGGYRKLEKAERLFLKAIALSEKDNYEYYEGLGWVYRRQKKYKEAEAMLQKAILIDQRASSSYHELGLCYTDQGKYKQAEEMLIKSLRIETAQASSLVS